VKVTAETITDAQIRELLGDALDRGDRDLAQVAQVALGIWHGSHPWTASTVDHTPACGVCGCRPDDEQHTGQARERCVAAWNARHGGGP
jgi:hypothetical protein